MPSLSGILADTTPLKVSPPFRRLWAGLTVANVGAQVTVVAVGLQVYDLTKSSLAVGTLGLCGLIPLIVLGLYGGALVDAFDRRKVALIAGVCMWVTTLAIAAQAWVQLNSVPVLYALVAVQSAAVAVNNPARSAIIPRLLEPALLPAANALQTIAWSITLSVGPLGGALLVAAWGFPWAYSIDAVLFLAALWAVWRLPDIPPVAEGSVPDAAAQAGGSGAAGPHEAQVGGDTIETRGAPRARGGVEVRGGVGQEAPKRSFMARWRAGELKVVGLRSVLDGLRYIRTQPNVRTTFLVDLAAMVLAFPRVLFPAVGVLYLGGQETTTGVLSAAFAVGAVFAGMFSGGLVRVRWQGRVIVWAIVAWGLSISAFGVVLLLVGPGKPEGVLIWALIAACVALAAAGAADSISAVFRQTILQSATPDAMRGRLQGVFIVVVAGGPRLGELVLGAEANWFGEAWAAVIGGLACVAVLWLIIWRQPRFLKYDAKHPEP